MSLPIKWNFDTEDESLGLIQVNELASGLADANTVLTQSVASTIWAFDNPLGKIPSVTLINSSGLQFVADIVATESNITVNLTHADTGKIILN